MKAIFLLADAAQVAEGKLNLLGAGWSITSGQVPSALAVKIDVPWNDANAPHTLALRLLDSDGNQILDLGTQTFEVGRPAGLPPGTSIDHVMAVNLGPLPMLAPGERYVWELAIDGHVDDDWRNAFYVRPASPPT
ncbi:MAG: DUF6941 family protein [Actinomycetota bacterium]